MQFHVSARESLLGKDKKKVFIEHSNDNEEVSAGKKTGKKYSNNNLH